MNYLAHAYLSFDDRDVLVGNMISDFVKGKKKYDYPSVVQQGMALHRAIDEFTDSHPVTRDAAGYFKPVYGLYGLAFMDVVYDHFLAVELAGRANEFLQRFSEATYEKIEAYDELLPERFKMLFPFMKQQNWLYNYQFNDGISKSFAGLVHRARYISESAPALRIFDEHYDKFREAYNNFFPDLLAFSLGKFADIH